MSVEGVLNVTAPFLRLASVFYRFHFRRLPLVQPPHDVVSFFALRGSGARARKGMRRGSKIEVWIWFFVSVAFVNTGLVYVVILSMCLGEGGLGRGGGGGGRGG